MNPHDAVRELRGHDNAFIALAHVRRGDLYSARVSLQAAQGGDPSFPVLQQVERALRDAGVEPFPTRSGTVPSTT